MSARRNRLGEVRQVVAPLFYVALKSSPPSFATRSKLSSAQARGKTFERKVIKEVFRQVKAKELPPLEIMVGPWIDYIDANGPGLCQPDLVLVGVKRLLIVEAKLKTNERAERQLALYSPLCAALWPRDEEPALCQVFKYPTCGRSPQWLDSLAILLANRRKGMFYWHYLPLR